jgi:hypothetical protein
LIFGWRPGNTGEVNRMDDLGKNKSGERPQLAKVVQARFAEIGHHPAQARQERVEIGPLHLPASAELDLGAGLPRLPLRPILEIAGRYAVLTAGACRPQLAALLFGLTGRPEALALYFPILHQLDRAGAGEFIRLARAIGTEPQLDLRLFGGGGEALPLQDWPEAAVLAAGHLAEIFFYRGDLLERLLVARPRIWLYATPEAFASAGGVAGGCYNPQKGALQLLLGRLFEGFYRPTPGVAPFLHEFGHLLDHFHPGRAALGASRGLLPGLSPEDGDLYSPQAGALFRRGKQLELQRYQAQLDPQLRGRDPLPIGHPYVFQNDTEFIAGYFEMFFRNPHYFAAQNPALYAAFAHTFGHDPRPGWAQDFEFYIQKNRAFYQSTDEIRAPGISLPKT